MSPVTPQLLALLALLAPGKSPVIIVIAVTMVAIWLRCSFIHHGNMADDGDKGEFRGWLWSFRVAKVAIVLYLCGSFWGKLCGSLISTVMYRFWCFFFWMCMWIYIYTHICIYTGWYVYESSLAIVMMHHRSFLALAGWEDDAWRADTSFGLFQWDYRHWLIHSSFNIFKASRNHTWKTHIVPQSMKGWPNNNLAQVDLLNLSRNTSKMWVLSAVDSGGLWCGRVIVLILAPWMKK